MAKGYLATVPAEKVPCHTNDGPHDDKYQDVHDVGAQAHERQDGEQYDQQSQQDFFHLPNLLRRRRDATPPGTKIKAATKIANLPSGAQPIPI